MAKSLTVPLTANVPMSPPGKNKGFTTKESVVKAILLAGKFKTVESCKPDTGLGPKAVGKHFFYQLLHQFTAAAMR